VDVRSWRSSRIVSFALDRAADGRPLSDRAGQRGLPNQQQQAYRRYLIGTDTLFSGPDYTIRFPGAEPKSSIESGTAAWLAPAANAPKGGASQKPTNRNGTLPASGGGGDASPFGAGGDGGVLGKRGGDAKGLCAGGGGAVAGVPNSEVAVVMDTCRSCRCWT